jgi:hypothetical protein
MAQTKLDKGDWGWADEKGDFLDNMLHLRFNAATIACGAPPFFIVPKWRCRLLVVILADFTGPNIRLNGSAAASFRNRVVMAS